MQRFKLTVEYDGTGYVGWQRQDNGLGVQQRVEEAVLAYSGETVTVFCAGRTDAGVHARGQVIHLDLDRGDSAETVRDAINFHLKPDAITILAAEKVDEGFHARFSAIGRRYLYRIINRRAPLAIDRAHAWWVPQPLAIEPMREAAGMLLGQHDFTTFRASICQAQSPVKTLDRLDIEVLGEEVRVHAEARSFLHHQVRNLVGTLHWVGNGRWQPEQVRQALEARDRTKGGPTAPAAGLYLMGVRYD